MGTTIFWVSIILAACIVAVIFFILIRREEKDFSLRMEEQKQKLEQMDTLIDKIRISRAMNEGEEDKT